MCGYYLVSMELSSNLVGAVEKDVLLILYVISTALITCRGGIVSPGHCFNSQGVAQSLKRATLWIMS